MNANDEKKTLKKLSVEYQTLLEEVEENKEKEKLDSVLSGSAETAKAETAPEADSETPPESNNLEPYSITFEAERSKTADEAEIILEGLKDFYSMRRGWSILLMISLVIIIMFNVVLVVLVGNGALAFNDEWFLRLVLTTNLGEIIGLIWLVVKFLFSHPPLKPES